MIATGSSEKSISVAKLTHPQVQWFSCDLADSKSIQWFAEAIGEQPLDMVVHNAGVQQARELFERTDEGLSIHDETQINFNAPIELTKLLFSNVENAKGSWVYVTSGLASVPNDAITGACQTTQTALILCIQSTSKSYRVDKVSR